MCWKTLEFFQVHVTSLFKNHPRMNVTLLINEWIKSFQFNRFSLSQFPSIQFLLFFFFFDSWNFHSIQLPSLYFLLIIHFFFHNLMFFFLLSPFFQYTLWVVTFIIFFMYLFPYSFFLHFFLFSFCPLLLLPSVFSFLLYFLNIFFYNFFPWI